MSVQDAKREVLTYLFECYEKDDSLYSITEIAQKHNIDQHELGKYLVERGLVKNQQYRPTAFICQITLDGIEEINPGYVREKMDEVIQALGESGSRGEVMEILGYEPKDYQKAFDLVKYMEARSLLKATQYFGGGSIVTELSLDGREYYEKNKTEWL
jgi:hypothetical protein